MHEPIDDVELERVHVFLVVVIARLFEGQHTFKSDVIPEGRGILTPDPLRIFILQL